MQILEKEEINGRAKESILNGAVFIHPTDTIYGLGCNALNFDAVKKIREIKERYTGPFSIIAPSIQWIKNNCIIDKKSEQWIKKLPGPYTLILKLKEKQAIAPNVNSDLDTIGIRMPNHWFANVISDIGVPVVTTSANIVNQNFMTSIDDLEPKIKSKVDFIIYEGEKKGRPSKIVDLTGEIRIIER